MSVRFAHLAADFPNGSPWIDWAKYTDEGWYSDAAIRHYLLGHWYVKGDFNPGVALPVWPLLEAVVFRFTGVSLVAARALAVSTFGISVACLFWLMERFPGRSPISATIAVFLLLASPFTYAFSRMAILEPPLLMFTMLALGVASTLRPLGPGALPWHALRPGAVLLGCLLATMVLTKPTAVALMPGVLYMLWCRAGRRFGPACRLAGVPLLVAFLVWGGYVLLVVRPHFQQDYTYLFTSNNYISFQLDPLAAVLANTVGHGAWMGINLYAGFLLACVLLVVFRPTSLRNPLVGSFLFMIAGYTLFLGYHNNFQTRYYYVLVVPVTAIFATATGDLLTPASDTSSEAQARVPLWRLFVQIGLALAIAVPDLVQQSNYVLHPEYSFLEAAEAVSRLIRQEPNHSQLLLSISGSDISLMTGIPSINDDFGVLDLDHRARMYRPGWYLAWNELDDDKLDALTPDFRPVRVATFVALDDPERDQMVLYRLDDTSSTAHPATRHRSPLARRGRGGHHGRVP